MTGSDDRGGRKRGPRDLGVLQRTSFRTNPNLILGDLDNKSKVLQRHPFYRGYYKSSCGLNLENRAFGGLVHT